MFNKKTTSRVVLMGGLGNQLFQYAYALRLSRITKSKVSLNPNLATVRKDDLGNPQISSYLLNPRIILEPDKGSPRMIRRFVGSGLRFSSSASQPLGKLISGCLLIVNKLLLSVYFKEKVTLNFSRNTGYWHSHSESISSFNIGYFQSYRYSEVHEDLDALRKIAPKRVYPEHNFLSQMAKLESPLVVHVRLTDYRTEEDFGIPSKSYYEKAITYQIRSGLYNKIWLFSDEPDEAMSFIPNDYLTQVRCISKELTDPIWSLEAMRLGRGYVIANSTFSWWGAYLSQTSDPVVVYPKPWFKGMPDPIEICPPSWKPFAR